MSVGENIRLAREKAGLSQSDLARRIGVSQSAIAQIEARDTGTKHIFRIAKELATSVEALSPTLAAIESAAHAIAPDKILAAGRDLPIYAAAEGGPGALIITWDAVEYMPRPAPLSHVKGGYGIYVSGESMAPRFEPGNIALVNPNMPPRANNDVVLFKNDGNGKTEAMIKRLVRATQTEWHVRQFNPEMSFSLLKSEWKQCQVVIGLYC